MIWGLQFNFYYHTPSLKFEECTFGKHSLGNMAQCLGGNTSLKSMKLVNEYGDQDWDDIVEVECLADVLKDLPMCSRISVTAVISHVTQKFFQLSWKV